MSKRGTPFSSLHPSIPSSNFPHPHLLFSPSLLSTSFLFNLSTLPSFPNHHSTLTSFFPHPSLPTSLSTLLLPPSSASILLLLPILLLPCLPPSSPHVDLLPSIPACSPPQAQLRLAATRLTCAQSLVGRAGVQTQPLCRALSPHTLWGCSRRSPVRHVCVLRDRLCSCLLFLVLGFRDCAFCARMFVWCRRFVI